MHEPSGAASDVGRWLALLRDGSEAEQQCARTELGLILEARGLLDDAADAYARNVEDGVSDRRPYERLAALARARGDHETEARALRGLADLLAPPPTPSSTPPVPPSLPVAGPEPRAEPEPEPIPADAATTDEPPGDETATDVPPADEAATDVPPADAAPRFAALEPERRAPVIEPDVPGTGTQETVAEPAAPDAEAATADLTTAAAGLPVPASDERPAAPPGHAPPAAPAAVELAPATVELAPAAVALVPADNPAPAPAPPEAAAPPRVETASVPERPGAPKDRQPRHGDRAPTHARAHADDDPGVALHHVLEMHPEETRHHAEHPPSTAGGSGVTRTLVTLAMLVPVLAVIFGAPLVWPSGSGASQPSAPSGGPGGIVPVSSSTSVELRLIAGTPSPILSPTVTPLPSPSLSPTAAPTPLPARCADAGLRFPETGDPEGAVRAAYREYMARQGVTIDPASTLFDGLGEAYASRHDEVVAGWAAVTLQRERRGLAPFPLVDYVASDVIVATGPSEYQLRATVSPQGWSEMRAWPAETCEGAFMRNPANARWVDLMQVSVGDITWALPTRTPVR
jgi:hypothetical protein